MRNGWGPRRKLHRTATAFVALALLPVGVLIASAHAGAPQASPALGHLAVAAEDIDQPSVEALQRSQASNLFAPFSWDGQIASGPFVQFSYFPNTGIINGYFAMNGSSMELLVQTIQIVDFVKETSPLLMGPLFTASGIGVTLVAHEEPMALLEIKTDLEPRTVILTFPDSTSLEVSHAPAWPDASVSFSVGESNGRVIVGRGSIAVNGTTVTASLKASDYLGLRAVPSYAEHRAERTAILDAFASGRLAAEYDLVAMTNGGWLENAAHFQDNLTLTSSSVDFNQAALAMTAPVSRDGLILLAFDPRTMPADSGHRLVVTDGGTEIREAPDPLASFYAAPGSTSQPLYSQLSMNATVIVVYLPDMVSPRLQVESVVLPSAGLDGATQLAMLAAAFIVSVAAAVMFRSRHE